MTDIAQQNYLDKHDLRRGLLSRGVILKVGQRWQRSMQHIGECCIVCRTYCPKRPVTHRLDTGGRDREQTGVRGA